MSCRTRNLLERPRPSVRYTPRRGPGLRWDDVNFKASSVTVNRRRSRSEKGIVVAPPKTDLGRRTIDIDSKAVSVLREWRWRQLEERMAFESEWHDTGLIFTKNNGSAFDPEVATRRFDRLVNRTDLPRIRFHD